MASSGKPKTTMAKLKREATLRERRVEKATRKRIRKLGQLDQDPGVEEFIHAPELDAPEFDSDTPESEVDLDVRAPESADRTQELSASESALGVRP